MIIPLASMDPRRGLGLYGGVLTRSEIILELGKHLDVVAFSDGSIRQRGNIHFYPDRFTVPRIIEFFAWFVSVAYYLVILLVHRPRFLIITVPSAPHHELFALVSSMVLRIPVVSIVVGYVSLGYAETHRKLILAQLAWSHAVVFTTRRLGRHYNLIGFVPKSSLVTYAVNPISRTRVMDRIPRSMARQKLNLPTEGKIVLTVGRYDPFKNLEDFCEVSRKMRRMWTGGFHAVMISATSSFPEYEAHVKDLMRRTPDSITLDNVPYEVIPLYLRSADCIVLSSRTDNYSRVLLEALANGVTIVSYEAGLEELKDFSVDQSRGLITVPTGSVKDLVDKVYEVLASGESVSTRPDPHFFTDSFVIEHVLKPFRRLLESG